MKFVIIAATIYVIGCSPVGVCLTSQSSASSPAISPGAPAVSPGGELIEPTERLNDSMYNTFSGVWAIPIVGKKLFLTAHPRVWFDSKDFDVTVQQTKTSTLIYDPHKWLYDYYYRFE